MKVWNEGNPSILFLLLKLAASCQIIIGRHYFNAILAYKDFFHGFET